MKIRSIIYRTMIITMSLVLVAGISGLDFAYGEGNTSDDVAPVINHFTFWNPEDESNPHHIDAQGKICFIADVTETGSGVESIQASFQKMNGDEPADLWVNMELFSAYVGDGDSPDYIPYVSGSMVEYTIPTTGTDSFIEEGEYRVSWIYIRDGNGNDTYYYPEGSDFENIFGSNTNVTVDNINTNADRTPPEINSFTINNAEKVDAQGCLNVTIDITEEGCGVFNIVVYFEHESETIAGHSYGTADYSSSDNLLHSNEHTLDLPIAGPLLNGRNFVTGICIYDANGNCTEYFAGEGPLATQMEINVVNSKIADDSTPPEIKSISSQYNKMTPGDVWTVDIDIIENESGVNNIDFVFVDESGNELYFWWTSEPESPVEDSPEKERLYTGKHRLKMFVGPFVKEGAYFLESVTILDQRNATVYDSSNLSDITDSITLTIEQEFDFAKYAAIENVDGQDGVVETVNSAEAGQVILVDCSRNYIVPKRVFEAIAGKDIILVFRTWDAQWVFDGKKVELSKCKDVDLETRVHVEKGEKMGFADDDKVLVIDFADNGVLPGETEVRINSEFISVSHDLGLDHLLLSYVKGDSITVEDDHVNIEYDRIAVLKLDHNSSFVLSANKPIWAIKEAVIKVNDCVFTGKALNPSVTVVMGSKTLTRQRDYTISMSNNTKVGTARVVVKGVGNYKGTKTKNFNINPKKAAISKVKAGKKKITVKMKTKPSALGASSYRIEYRIAGKGAWKSTTTSGKSKTIKKLKKGKKYQVRVIAYSGARQGSASVTKKTGKVK